MGNTWYRGRFQPWVPGTRTKTLLAGYRTFALVVGAIQALYLSNAPLSDVSYYTLIGIVSVYSLIKVFYPFHWYRRDFMTHLVIGADLTLGAFLPFITGGLNSPFLLYTLCPLLTIALIMPRGFAYIGAGFLSVAVLASEVVSANLIYPAAGAPYQYSLSLLVVYIILCALCAWLPYMANANVHSMIKSNAILEERRRLSQEMHDTLAQSLTSLNWNGDLLVQMLSAGKTEQALAQASNMKQSIQAINKEVRESIDLLRQKTVQELGFIPVLTGYVHEFTKLSNIKCELLVADGHVEMPPLAGVQLLRIAQEALTNARKHARPSKIDVSLISNKSQLEMIIKDDGAGFIPPDADTRHHRSFGHGLSIMKERAESLGGRVTVSSQPGQGTEIRVSVPVNAIKWLRSEESS